MKGLLKVVCIMSLGLLLVGCTAEKDGNNSESVQLDTELTKSSLEVGDGFTLGYDEPRFVERNQAAMTEDGYYFFSNEYLKFYDKQARKTVPVCSQITCNHKNTKCDAYFSLKDYRTELGIWYYDNKLYLVGSDQSYHLLSVNLDGSDREKVMDLFKYEGNDSFLYSVTLHRGYLYYSLLNDDYIEPASLYQAEVKKNATPEIIYTAKEAKSKIYRFKGYGDGIFFQLGCYDKDPGSNDSNYTASIYYITSSGESFLTLDGPKKFYNVVDEKVFYATDSGEIRVFDWNTKTDELFYDAKVVANISFDSKYIYIDNHWGADPGSEVEPGNRSIVCLDRSGNIIHILYVSAMDSDACIFGGDDYLLMWIESGDDDHRPNFEFSAYDKEQLLSGGVEWEAWDSYSFGEANN